MTTVLLFTGLVLGATLSIMFWPQKVQRSMAVQETPTELILTGIVRDFQRDHPDFDVVPPGGVGHVAGSVEERLDGLKRPVHDTGGYRVLSQWTDAQGRRIAPHLAGTGGEGGESVPAGVWVEDLLLMSDGRIDSFDAAQGPYGQDGNQSDDAVVRVNSTTAGAVEIDGSSYVGGDVLVGPGGDPASVIDSTGSITGTVGTQEQPFAMPPIVVPGDEVVGPNTGDVWFHHTPSTITGNMHVDDFRVSTEAVVTIDGNVTILVEGEFRTETKGVIQVLPHSSLDIYVMGKFTVETRCLWSDPRNTRVYILSTDDPLKLQTDADFYGTIIVPDSRLLIQTDGELHGSYIGRELQFKTGGQIHVTGSGPTGCLAVNDTMGSPGSAHDGGVSSAETFGEWFRDVLGVNQSAAHAITLVRGADGVYEHATNHFNPIDGRLFGNEGQGHNYQFTYAIAASFVFEACAGQFIEIEGGDGAWVFVDGKLAVDLGGVASGTPQHLDLDRLGLEDGRSYPVHLFYAQRLAGSDGLRVRTNVELSTAGYVPTVTEQYD
jgi:fibro-slime domain-containing protein